MMTIIVPEWIVWCAIIWGGFYVLDVLTKLVGLYLNWRIAQEKNKLAQNVAKKVVQVAETEASKFIREMDGAPTNKEKNH